jgi:putative ABC transport system permease protein
MAIPVSYNIRNLAVRRTTTAMTALGVALTVAVLLSVMALVAGLRTAFKASGDARNVLILRKGGTSELSSNFNREAFLDLKSNSGIARDAQGQPLASLEMVTIVSLPRPGKPEGSNITLRGVSAAGKMLRDLKVSDGRWFTEGRREIVVGKSIARNYPDAQIGKSLRFGKGLWQVVGVMDAGQSAVNSEIWGDLNQICTDFNRPNVLSSALVRAVDTTAVPALINSINDDRRLSSEARSEISYFESQMISAAPVQFLGIFVSVIMAIGSSFAAMNTMYAAVARRSKEIGTLRILGFSRASILLSFFLESLVLSVLGGVIGILLVLPLNNIQAGIGSFITFSEISFNFKVTPAIMATGVAFALLMGAIGGLFPARMAAKKEILTALREG